MKTWITSPWLAVVLGAFVFMATLSFLMKQQQGQVTQAAAGSIASPDQESVENSISSNLQELSLSVVKPASTSIVGSGPQTFTNPEVVKLLTELRLEKQELLLWEKRLNDLKRQLDLEMSELSFITQEMMQTKLELERLLRADQNHLRSEETNRLYNLARVYTNMAPNSAVQILNQMPVDDVAKILFLMGERESAAILQTSDPVRAAELTERIRKITRPPEPATASPPRR